MRKREKGGRKCRQGVLKMCFKIFIYEREQMWLHNGSVCEFVCVY